MSKPRFFRIHLSTAVVLMFVAAMLVWANVRELDDDNYGLEKYLFGPRYFHGWPFHFRKFTFSWGNLQTSSWSISLIICDALIALAILLSVGVACEWRIRRRAARDPQ